ncbi:MAG: hypothetical protein IPL31_17680 [Saprospiraceae bacterium]|nr:hypothetical protein [Saprospiraceae bacterium]
MLATTISEVIDQLDVIVKYSVQNGDRAGYFAALYKKVTVAVSEKIKLNYFDDNKRMEMLDVIFANRYLEAYQQYKSNISCSASWQLAFDETHSWKPMVIHHLIAGMNAHIGLDLGVAAATIAPGNQIQNIQNDFNKINSILNELIHDVKSDLFDMWPLSKFITELKVDHLQNTIAGFSMLIARDAAWRVAVDIAAIETDAARESYIIERDKKVATFGKKLQNPGFYISTLMYIFRFFEFGTIESKIKKLDD